MTRIAARTDPDENRANIVAGIKRAASSDHLLDVEECYYLVAESTARILGGRSPYADMIALPSDFTMRALGNVHLKRVAGEFSLQEQLRQRETQEPERRVDYFMHQSHD